MEDKRIENHMNFFSSSNNMDSQMDDISIAKSDIKEAIKAVCNNAAAGPMVSPPSY